MQDLQALRKRKPAFYPDHTLYAEYACAAFGLIFEDLDGGTGLIFRIGSEAGSRCFAAGRCSFFPQNDATAATLAADKHFASRIMAHAGLPTLGGDYFFLNARHRAHRPPGHERTDALAYLDALGGAAFAKPLHGSRGDFAEPVEGADALARYLDRVSRVYDSVLLQPAVTGDEYRIFLLDGDVLYSARKTPPVLAGDGVHTVPELMSARAADLESRGISPAVAGKQDADGTVPAAGTRQAIAGRMNRSAGGGMSFADPPNRDAVFDSARRAVAALGLRAGAVDLFTDVDGDPHAVRIIEVNANPSIRFLEDINRADLILDIWRHTLAATGLLDV